MIEPLYGLPCSSCNVLGQCCPGAYQCGGVCSVAAPVVPPVIAPGAFWAFPATIPNNTATTLNWNIPGATSVFIDNGVGGPFLGPIGSISTPLLTSTTIFTLVATNSSGVTTAQATVTVLGGADFKICPASAIIGITPFQFNAYYRAGGGTIDCSNLTGTTDVTDAVAWLSSNQNVARVGNNDGSPRGRTARGVSTGSSTISVTPYLGLHASAFAIANVVCVPTNSCASASSTAISVNKCSNDPVASFTIDDGCGTIVTCPGTRACDFNWKEVGQ